MTIDAIRGYIEKTFGAPGRDLYGLPTSGARFPDGAHYRTELLPTTVAEYERVLSLCEKFDFIPNKITDIRGAMFDSDAEIIQKCRMCREKGIELVMSPGSGEHPRDISHQMAVGAMKIGRAHV